MCVCALHTCVCVCVCVCMCCACVQVSVQYNCFLFLFFVVHCKFTCMHPVCVYLSYRLRIFLIYHTYTYARHTPLGVEFPSGEEPYDFQFVRWMTTEKVYIYYNYVYRQEKHYSPQTMCMYWHYSVLFYEPWKYNYTRLLVFSGVFFIS